MRNFFYLIKLYSKIKINMNIAIRIVKLYLNTVYSSCTSIFIEANAILFLFPKLFSHIVIIVRPGWSR